MPTRCMSSGKQKESSHHAPRMSETIIMISPNWEAAWVQTELRLLLELSPVEKSHQVWARKKNQLLMGVTCCKPATVSLVGLRDFRPELKYGHHIPNLETTEFNQSTPNGGWKIENIAWPLKPKANIWFWCFFQFFFMFFLSV